MIFLRGLVSPLQGSSTFLPPINYFVVFMRLALACSQVGAYRVSYYSYLCKDLILGML
jgi:hypothetical protein